MLLTNKNKQILRNLIDKKMSMMLDWTDFLEDAEVPLNYLNDYLMCKRDEISENHLTGIGYALGISPGELSDKLSEKLMIKELKTKNCSMM
ncbi:MAG: hypothetical protein GX675_02955 [Erysipelotrichaceae bacterium]|nr:hypothetical protein [Erysipelotrichaceae bacterium]